MRPRATASALCFVLLATLTVLVVVDFPGVASVQPTFRGGNGGALAASSSSSSNKRDGERDGDGETTTTALPSSTTASSSSSNSSSSSSRSRSSSSSLNVLNSDDLVHPTTDASTEQDNQCPICHEDTTEMEENQVFRCNHARRHAICMRCFANFQQMWKNPKFCPGCATQGGGKDGVVRVNMAAWSEEQKAVYAQCQAELRVGGEGEAEDEDRLWRRRAYEESQTPLMRALETENAEEAQRLIRQGEVGDVNAVDLDGRSTLMYFFPFVGSEVLQQLLDYSIQTEQPIDVNYVNQQSGVSTLMFAIYRRTSAEIIQQLFAYSIRTGQSIDVNYVDQRSRQSTFMWALVNAGSEVVQHLSAYSIQTEQPMDVNYVNPYDGLSILMYAIQYAGREVLPQLLAYSIQTGQSIDVNYVIQQTGESTFEAALRDVRFIFNPEDALNIVRVLIHHPSFDVNRPLNEKGETALMLALSLEHGRRADVAKELLKLPRIDLNQKNNDGKTAKQYALESSNDEIRKLLVSGELAGKTWFTRLHEMLERWGYGPPLM